MDQDMITDITLDHLPDLSDASISFQIPSRNASADLLLADQTDGFDLLRNVVDDDASFAPVTLLKPRGPPLVLGELTPRAQATPRRIAQSPSPTPIQVPCSPANPRPIARSQSPTPIQVPYSSAKPSVIPHRLTLGHRSPDKLRKTPSRPKFIHRIETPFFSEERLDQLRIEVETLRQEEVESPTHVHVVQATHDGFNESNSLSCANSNFTGDAPPIPPASGVLDSVAEEKEAHLITDDRDVVMGTEAEGPTDAMDVAVPMPRAKSKRDPRTRAKSVVAAGGSSKPPTFPITHVSKKAKKNPSRVREEHQILPATARQIAPPQSIAINAEGLVPSACMGGDIDPNPENTQTAGIAERLVSYSQSVISSFGLSKPKSEKSLPEIPRDVVRVENARSGPPLPPGVTQPSPPPLRRLKDTPSAHDVEPLRLSEISPHKPPDSPAYSGELQDGRQHPMSPLRPAKKRASTDGDQPQEYHRRKRGKTMPVDMDLERGSPDEAISQASVASSQQANDEDHMVTHSETRDNTRHSDSLKSTLPSARTKYRPKLNFSSRCKGPTLDPFPNLSKSRQAQQAINQGRGQRNETDSKTARIRSGLLLNRRSARTRLRRENSSCEASTLESSHGRQPSGPISTTVDLPLIEKKQNATLLVAPLTKPVGFTFRVDARLEARKTEGRLAASEPAKVHPLHSISDCKPLGASHQVGVGSHKAGVVPIVPVVPFFFCTEQRAKEREKFDEMVKRKEEEMHKLKEEERRREAKEEERTIRELRRKAVPKANEIPEWYADMPKKKGRRCEIEVDRENAEN